MNKNEIIIFKDDDLELEVNVSPKDDTIWLTQEQMAELFARNKSTISRHINNVFNSGELVKNNSIALFATELNIVDYRTGKIQNAIRNVEHYNLDVIISVGYRVNSKRGTIFRRWANNILKEYIIKGYVVDAKRVLEYEENYLSFTKTIKMISSLVDRKELTLFEFKSLLVLLTNIHMH